MLMFFWIRLAIRLAGLELVRMQNESLGLIVELVKYRVQASVLSMIAQPRNQFPNKQFRTSFSDPHLSEVPSQLF